MRLTAINCIFLACTAVVLASEPRPRRHLHQIKKIIANTLFGCNESKCTQSKPSQPDVKFFKIPGFNNVVVKAVPKGSTAELPPFYEEIPPNSRIGIIGSYLGTNNLNDTYSALQGVMNLLQSGILSTNNGALNELLQPSKFQNIATPQIIPVKPYLTPGYAVPSPLEPIPVVVRPTKVPELLPTQYSYKQVNQDGTLTTYTSSLDINKGVKVMEQGKTLPFFIDRIQKIPVQLPVPVLPEVTKIFIPNPYDNFGPYPLEPIHPGSSYSYHQVHHDGKLTTYTGLPPLNGKYDGPVFVSQTRKAIPPPLVFSRDPFINYFRPNPAIIDVPVPAEQVIYNAPIFLSRVLPPEQGRYSYTQVHQDGGKTTAHSALPAFNGFTKNPAVSVTKYGVSAPALDQLPTIPEMNLLRPSAPDSSAFSYNQVHADGKMTRFTGSGVQEYAGVKSAAPGPLPGSSPFLGLQGMPLFPYSITYKPVGDSKMTTHTESEKAMELNGAKLEIHTVSHPSFPPHISDRIEKVAAGAKFKLPPLSTMLPVNPHAVPIPSSFVNIPSVHIRRPLHSVQIPSTSFQSPFDYKYINSDGSVTSYGGDGRTAVSQPPKTSVPIPLGHRRVFESSINPGPFPINVNPNAVKPSTPVSGSYSYKLVHDGQVNNQLPAFNGITKNPAVSVTKYGVSAPALDQLPKIPEMNLLRPSAPDSSAFSYNQVHADGKMISFTGSGVQEYGGVKSASPGPLLESLPFSGSEGMPPTPNLIAYKPVSDGRMPTYTESGKVGEFNIAKPEVHTTVSHPSIPPHISARIEKVAASAKFKLPPFSTMPLVNPFPVPVPSSFVSIPSVHTVKALHPVKMPSASFPSPFDYKHINSDGSVTSYGGDGRTADSQPPKISVPIPPGHRRVFESSINPRPFPINVNPNAVKPSTPVSSSYSYKLVHDGQVNNHAGVEPIDENPTDISSQDISSDQPFPVTSPMPIPAPVQGCVDPEITPNVGPSTVLFQKPVPLSYTYKQVSHSKPNSFLVVNLEDPVMDIKKVSHIDQAYQQYPNNFPSDSQNPNGYVFVPPSTDNIAAPPVSKHTVPQSSFSYKQATSHGLYEYTDEFDPSGVKTNEPQIRLKPQDNPTDNVYVEQTSNMPSSSQPVLSNANSFINNPIVVPEQILEQSRIDGSSINVENNSLNSMAVDVQQAERPESAQAHDTQRLQTAEVDETLSPLGQVNEASGPSKQVSEAPNHEHEQELSNPESTSGKPNKIRKIKRVKHRGDIPESD